jgi:uncharacterized protein YutE (UPF0331/DUF86 family)
MDKVVVAKKIDSILRCLNRIALRLPATQAEFFQDFDAQDVVVLNLTRTIQMCVDIATHILATKDQALPSTMAEAFLSLQQLNIITADIADKMRLSVSYRNVAVHVYDDIDLKITYDVARNHLADFKQYITQVTRHEGLV